MHLQTVMNMLMECSSCILFLRSPIMLTGVYCAAADGTSSTWCVRMGQRRVANTGFCFKATQEGSSWTVRVTTEPSSHMSNKSILIDSHRLNNVKICFVSCFSEIRVPHSSSFSVSFFCFLWFWEFFTKNTVFYFVFQVFVVLLNQPGSTEEWAKTAAEFQCHLRTQHSTESRGQYLTGFFFFYEQYGIHSLKLSISYVI